VSTETTHVEISGSSQRREVNLDEIWAEFSIPMTKDTTPIMHDFVPEVNAPQPHATTIDIPIENLNVQNNEPEHEDPIVENEI